MMHRHAWAIVLVYAVLCSRAHALGTPAGTTITNQAEISFNLDGTARRLVSNVAALAVAEVVDVDLLVQTPERLVASGAVAQPLLLTLTNTGNGTETFVLGMNTTVAGDEFDPVAAMPSIYFDTDASGDLSGGDTPYVSGANDPVLVPDQSLALLIVNDIPTGLGDGDRGLVELRARAATGTGAPGAALPGAGSGGVDAVFGTSGGEAYALGRYLVGRVSLLLSKSAVVSGAAGGTEPAPGATIVYTVLVSAEGTGRAAAAAFADPIPANTTYTPGSLSLNGVPMTDAADADAAEFVAGASEIRVQLGDIAVGDGARRIDFAVTIN